MNLKQLFDQVDVERLYQHVLNLEGERHPLSAPENLKAAADYIFAELERYGVSVRRQTFQVKGFAEPFDNVEGWIGDEDAPAAAIMNHFDTVENTTGANDNAAAVAVTLECARILAGYKDALPVRFLSFNLEEGNPAIESRIHKSLHNLGLMDAERRYTSYRVSKLLEKHSELESAAFDLGRAGKTYSEAIAEATAQLEDQMPGALVEHLKELEAIYQGMTAFPGQAIHLGAWAWVDEARKLGKKLTFGICLDEIGRVHLQEGCQSLPEQLTWEMLQTYKVDTERRVGDWAFIITDGAAAKLGGAFCGNCERTDIDLPYSYFHIPMDYEQITKELPQSLGSDFSAFWGAGIPALFLFDSANWRQPYRGHTMADTIDRLDFDQIAKICRVCLATLVDPTLRD